MSHPIQECAISKVKTVLLFLCLLGNASYNSIAFAFDTFEHRYISNEAFEKALSLVPSQDNVTFLNDLTLVKKSLWGEVEPGKDTGTKGYYSNEIPLRFGDLSGFGGDFAETPKQLEKLLKEIQESLSTKKPDSRFLATRRQWAHVCAWLRDRRPETQALPNIAKTPDKAATLTLNHCVRELLPFEAKPLNEVVLHHSVVSHGYKPSREEASEFERLPGYSSIASRNRAHFPSYSWKEYGQYHQTARDFAKCYRRLASENIADTRIKCDLPSISKEAYLSLALLNEGFAQHFLQDSLASGHLGSKYSKCITDWVPILPLPPLICFPTKDYLQHTHDVLNEIGLDVHVRSLGSFTWVAENNPVVGEAERDFIREAFKNGWTAFGDRSLFLAEASVHRHIVILYATESLHEVFAAMTADSDQCALCKAGVFPIPKDVSNSVLNDGGIDSNVDYSSYRTSSIGSLHEDRERVRPLSLEGWKALVAYGNIAKTRPPSSATALGGVDAVVSATTFEMGYVRSTEWWVPNYVGFGVLYSSTLVSVYPLSVGYWFDPLSLLRSMGGLECLEGHPVTMGIRLNAGFQTAEPSTKFNPNSSRSVLGELSGVMDVRVQVYGPVALYARLDFVRANGTDNIPWKTGSGFTGGTIGTLLGLSYDFAGIL